MIEKIRIYILGFGIIFLSFYIFISSSKTIDPNEIQSALQGRIDKDKAVGYYVGIIDDKQEYNLLLGQ